jgi:hypothetical protein
LQLPDDKIDFVNVKMVFDAYLTYVKYLLANILNVKVNIFVEFDRMLAVVPAILIIDRLKDEENIKF